MTAPNAPRAHQIVLDDASQRLTTSERAPSSVARPEHRVYGLGEAAVEELSLLMLAVNYPLRTAHDALLSMRIHTSLHDPQRRAWVGVFLRRARAQRVSGITLGPDVFLAHPSLIRNWPLLAHEATHVVQTAHRRLVPFLMNYGWQWSKRRMQGMDSHTAYLAIPDEVEARSVERRAASVTTLSHPWLIELPA